MEEKDTKSWNSFAGDNV